MAGPPAGAGSLGAEAVPQTEVLSTGGPRTEMPRTGAPRTWVRWTGVSRAGVLRGHQHGVVMTRRTNSRPRSAPGPGQPAPQPGRRVARPGRPMTQPDRQTPPPGQQAPRLVPADLLGPAGLLWPADQQVPRPGQPGQRAGRPGQRVPGRRYPRAISACRHRALRPTARPRLWPGRPAAGCSPGPPRRAVPWPQARP
jgi:hypothetical protein